MNPKVTLKTLLFEMDGVLVDVSRSYRRTIEETVGQFTGRAILPGTIQRYREAGDFGDDWRLAHAIITDTGMTVPFNRVVEEFQRRYRGEHWNGFISEEPPYLTQPTLAALGEAGCLLGVVSGRPNDEVQWTLERFGWKRHFPLVVPREKHDGRPRQDPYALQHALLILDAAGRRVNPGEAAVVGATPAFMVAARAAGLWAIGFVPAAAPDRLAQVQALRAEGAHAVIESLDGLPALVNPFVPQVPGPVIEDEASA